MSIKDAVLFLVNNLVSTMLALAAAAAFVAKVKPVGRSIKRRVFAALYTADEKHDKRMDNLEMQQLKQIICNAALPAEDRLNAGEDYIRRGGNGEIKARHEALKRVYAAKLEREGL
jgi:hypothetical protein